MSASASASADETTTLHEPTKPSVKALPPEALPPEVVSDEVDPIIKKQNLGITLPSIPASKQLQLYEIAKKYIEPRERESHATAILINLKEEAENKEANAFREHNGPTEISVIEKAAIMSTVAEGLFHLAEIVSKSPLLSGIVMGTMGVVIASPIGQSIIGIGGLIAVGYFAIIAMRAKFAKVFKVIRTLDEFSILLDKIRRMINLTVFISGTYKFDINVEEITAQIKIIFKRFDQTLDDIDYKNIRKDVTTPASLGGMDIGNAAEHAIVTSASTVDGEIAEQQKQKPEPVTTPKGGRRLVKRKTQIGGSWLGDNYTSMKQSLNRSFKRLRFPVEEWNRNLIDDIVRLNIRLTTAMGEFNIVLNVLQMSMIAKTIEPELSDELRKNAIESFIAKNNQVKNSSEYQNLLVGILVNDILAIKVDFDYCLQGGSGKASTDSICIEYTQTDDAGNFVTTYRPKLHKAILKLCEQLKNGEGYDDKLKQTIIVEVINPYIELLRKAKFDANPPDILATLKSLNIVGEIPDDKTSSINKGLDKCVTQIYETGLRGINQPVVQPPVVQPPVEPPVVQHGGVWNPFKSNKHTAETNTRIIEYLVDEPTNLISNDNLAAYFQKVYRFVQIISKPTEKEKAETFKQVKNAIPEQLSSHPGVEVVSTANINQPLALDDASPPAPAPAPPAQSPDPAAAPAQSPDPVPVKNNWGFSNWLSSSTANNNQTNPAAAPDVPAKNKGFFGWGSGGRSTRKKARRTKSAQHPKPKSYKYRVKL